MKGGAVPILQQIKAMENIISQNKLWIDEVWNKIDAKMQVVSEASKNKIPYTTVNGIHDDVMQRDVSWWTNGFWPGIMWLLYVDTKNEQYKKVAQRAEELLDAAFQDFDGLHHDVGFMWKISSGVDYRLFGSKESRLRTIYAANILASRYNPAGRFIRSWNDDKVGWVIIDSMMNIPILYWAAKELKDDRYKVMAMNHADTVMKTHIRPDGSSHHIVNLNPADGEVVETFGGQGYCNGSSWSRGQAWAIYGFTLSYIHTGKQEYFDTAKKVANYFLANCAQTGYIPLVDFRAPEKPVMIDTTAGACAACGMIEIAKACQDKNEARMYINGAMQMLKALEKHCNYTIEEQSLLQDGTEAYHSEKGIHIPIIYGDYYFIEALYKLRGNDMLFW